MSCCYAPAVPSMALVTAPHFVPWLRRSWVRLPSALPLGPGNAHARPAPHRLRRLSFPVAVPAFSLLSGLSAVPPLRVSGTIPTLFRQEENHIMANQKPSAKTFETQHFVALESAQVPSVKADTALQ